MTPIVGFSSEMEDGLDSSVYTTLHYTKVGISSARRINYSQIFASPPRDARLRPRLSAPRPGATHVAGFNWGLPPRPPALRCTAPAAAAEMVRCRRTPHLGPSRCLGVTRHWGPGPFVSTLRGARSISSSSPGKLLKRSLPLLLAA